MLNENDNNYTLSTENKASESHQHKHVQYINYFAFTVDMWDIASLKTNPE